MRTITEVVDYENENEIKAEKFFAQDIDVIFKQRYELEKAIQQNIKKWVCPFCRQSIKIRGKRNGDISLHFAHVADQLDCPIKTWKNYTKDQILRMKYNGQKESPTHEKLKKLIADKLSKDHRFSEIKVEKRFEGICKDWRKPDVSAIYNGKAIVFELQLTTTFLSVIAERNLFYQENKTYIIWLFGNQVHNVEKMRFMEKDIFYPNNHNAFFIDEESQDSKFTLICGYERPVLFGSSMNNIWNTLKIDFSELSFDENFQVSWFDYEKEKNKIQKDLERIRLAEFGKLWQMQNKDERRNLFDKFRYIFNTKSENVNFHELSALLDCLYSIKFKNIIGYNYQKLIQLLHQYFLNDMNKDSHFGEYVLKAIGVYGARDQVLLEDKTRKFVNKAKYYKQQNFEICNKYDNILKHLFPELFDEISK